MDQERTDTFLATNRLPFDEKMHGLAIGYKIPADDVIRWKRNSVNYRLLYKEKVLYQESIQHVSAVANLMHIPQELWLLWAFSVVLLAKYKKPVTVSFDERLELFKQAYAKTIKQYYNKAEKFPVTIELCPNCQTISHSKILYKHTPIRPIAIVLCRKCGLGMRYPRSSREELSKIYEEDYFSGNTTYVGYADYVTEETWRIKKAENYLDRLESLLQLNPKRTTVLDVGSGFGYFLLPLKKRGYQYLGIELASEAVAIAKKKYKTKTLAGDLQLLNNNALKAGQFDLITLWDVIEHFHDFREELAIMKTLLRPNGFVALRTNNIESIEYQVFGKDFHSIKNEHTFYYADRALTDIFASVAIMPYKIWTHTHLFLAFMTKKEIGVINRTNRGGDIFYVGQKTN